MLSEMSGGKSAHSSIQNSNSDHSKFPFSLLSRTVDTFALHILEAVLRIQRAFRMWRAYLPFLHHRSSKKSSSSSSSCLSPLLDPKDYWNRMKSSSFSTSSSDDMFLLWRSVIELRRNHSSASTDTCLQVLFQVDGNLSKAQLLLNNPQTVLEFERTPLTAAQRDFFTPKVAPFKGSNITINKSINEALVNSYFSKKNHKSSSSSPKMKAKADRSLAGRMSQLKAVSASLELPSSSSSSRDEARGGQERRDVELIGEKEVVVNTSELENPMLSLPLVSEMTASESIFDFPVTKE